MTRRCAEAPMRRFVFLRVLALYDAVNWWYEYGKNKFFL